mgnify:FL=1
MTSAPFIASEVAEVIYRGQTYQRIRIEPFVRKDGSKTAIAIWSKNCPQCRRPFECTTPAIAPRFRPPRRCLECRVKCKWGGRFKTGKPAPARPLPDGRPITSIDAYEGERKT